MNTSPSVSAKVGRPSGYATELAQAICERIANGESLRGICSDESMPSTSMVLRWVSSIAEFRELYTASVQSRIELHIDALLDIADAPAERCQDGKVDPAWVSLQKLRLDTRKWAAAKLLPRKYGDNAALAIEAKHNHRYVVEIPARRTDDPMEWARLVHAERVASGELPPDAPPPGQVVIQ